MKTEHKLPPLTQDVLFGLNEDLFPDDVGRAMLSVYFAGVCDQRIAGMIQDRVRREKMRQAFRQMPFRASRLSQGELLFGIDLLTGEAIQVPIQYLNANALTTGGSGCGKTTKSKFYILQIAPHVQGMWLYDLRKREFRSLRPLLARVGIDLVVVPARSMRLNPLQLPLGVEPASYVPRVADMLVQVLGMPPRASSGA